MNAKDLDRLATSLAVPGTRRRLLRLLAALPVAGLLSLHPAEAAKRPALPGAAGRLGPAAAGRSALRFHGLAAGGLPAGALPAA